MIKFSREFFKKSFTSETSMKQAYMDSVKWYATNILAKSDVFQNVHVQFIKENISKTGYPTVTIHLFAVIDNEKDVMKKHCECCKEMHHSFFINADSDCSRCNALGLQKRLDSMLKVKKDMYKNMINNAGR